MDGQNPSPKVVNKYPQQSKTRRTQFVQFKKLAIPNANT